MTTEIATSRCGSHAQPIRLGRSRGAALMQSVRMLDLQRGADDVATSRRRRHS
jgi:hypothetical protein